MKQPQAAPHYDLVIIGAGSAGVSAAVQTAKLQRSVCILDKNSIGGAWIHTGTLPSKTLREVLAMTNSVRVHADKRFSAGIIKDMLEGRIFERAKSVSESFEQHVHRYLAKNNVPLLAGTATIIDRHTVRLTDDDGNSSSVRAGSVLITTGSRPRRPDSIPFDGKLVLDADEVLQLEHAPSRLVIYGAGVIGCEYACIFAALGVETVLADTRPNIMPSIDGEIAAELQAAMQTLGVELRLNEQLLRVKVDSAQEVIVELEGSRVRTNMFLYTSGREPNTGALWDAGLAMDVDSKGMIQVDKNFQTSVEGIFAAGDVIGMPALAATSSHQGRVAAANALGISTFDFPSTYPIGVYTIPELSSIGATEEELLAAGVEYVVGRAHYGEIARGFIRGERHGRLKLLVGRKTHRVLGVHIVGEGACELIHIGMVFMHSLAPVQELAQVVYNYPTLAEGYKIAAFNALNKLFPDGHIGNPNVDL
ncbi:MAG: Si-specific NAD(P)(+) transhydrogenase [Pseudomonadota bacterium]|nr:Si-specific NAD(P)(+) transhydrogenase [Pseudomonadota bacterium]